MLDVEFKKHTSGLHYWDSIESKTGNIFASLEMEEDIPDGNIFVNTVQENIRRYSKRDVKMQQRLDNFTEHLISH